MAKQGDTERCTRTGCNGTMTYYQKLKVDENADPPVQPGDTIGLRPDRNYAGWLCDADWQHHDFDKA
jgi:hypothetical protein